MVHLYTKFRTFTSTGLTVTAIKSKVNPYMFHAAAMFLYIMQKKTQKKLHKSVTKMVTSNKFHIEAQQF
jgi:hypothetical protein